MKWCRRMCPSLPQFYQELQLLKGMLEMPSTGTRIAASLPYPVELVLRTVNFAVVVKGVRAVFYLIIGIIGGVNRYR
jgi:hypothetical protein